MRRIICILAGVLIIVFALSIFVKPAIILLARKQLSKIFVDSAVNVADCNFKPLHLISFSDIEIKRDRIYAIKIKEAGMQYNPLSIIRGNILKFYLKGSQVNINLPGKSISGFSKLLKLNTGKSPFLINSLELENLGLNINSKELTLDASVSSQINLPKQLLNDINLKINSLQTEGLELKDATLRAGQEIPLGSFYIQQINYDKLKIEKIQSNVKLKDKYLFLDSLSADLLSGKIQGDLSLLIDKIPEYSVNLKVADMDLDTFVNDFKLNEKLNLSGRLSGVFALEGSGLNFTFLNGDFSSNAPGGDLTIKDKSYLEKIARNSGKSLDILVESFKNYHYNNGMVKLSLQEGNLIFNIAMEGETGKRNLAITLHNFRLRR